MLPSTASPVSRAQYSGVDVRIEYDEIDAGGKSVGLKRVPTE
jgi:hypothetical protein